MELELKPGVVNYLPEGEAFYVPTSGQLGGTKFDQGKARLDLMPPDALLAIANVLTYGAEKYGARNWEEGLAYGRLFAAAQRHLLAWQGGEENDPETGLPHLAHAGCCVMMLISTAKRGIGADDRGPDQPK